MNRGCRRWPGLSRKEGSMRLDILHSGYTRGTKILFAVIKLVSGYPLPDAAKIVFYRKEFYGRHMAR